MKPPDEIEINILLQNNTPQDYFQGLSSNDMHSLLYEPFGEDVAVRLNKHLEHDLLNQIPLLRVLETYLNILKRDKQIKLTPLGALPKKVIAEVYEKRFILNKDIEAGITKLGREGDCIFLKSARLTAELAGLVRKANGKLFLTKAASKLIETNNREELFKRFFQAFTSKFSWAFNDNYPEQTIAQTGWAFSIILLYKFGKIPRPTDFYANNYRTAFPHFLSFFRPGYLTIEEQFSDCYAVRTFDRFMFWFGFVTIEKQDKLAFDFDKVQRTSLFDALFTVDLDV